MSGESEALNILLDWCDTFTHTRKMSIPGRAELAALYDTVAEQARQLAAARKIIEIGATIHTGSKNHNGAYNELCRGWLAANPAHPAPQPDEAQR